MDTTLGSKDGTLAYMSKSMETLSDRCRELLSEERQLKAFARVPARAREVDRMARDIAGRDQKLRTRAVSGDSELRRKLRSVIAGKRRVVRIVLFGNSQFGHSPRGPCPRKALIRAIWLRCAVLLFDEFNASGLELQQVSTSRVFRCQSRTDGDSDCIIANDLGEDGFDRDVNGALNIGWAGAMQFLGKPRPKYLSRNN
ncbi:unnamed protein product [Chrysoparadoxa australica]